MPSIEDFMDGVMAEFRGRLALLGDSEPAGCASIRGAIEDGVALLMAYRRSDRDVARFEMLLSTLRSGRCPDGLSVLRPRMVAEEIGRRWAAYGMHVELPHEASAVIATPSGAKAPPLLGNPDGARAPRLLQPIN